MKIRKNKAGGMGMRICIDPGHSGPMEPGACAGGVMEAEINLQVSKILARMLEKAGHKVKLTREDDVEDAELDWRVELAWKFRTDIYVCIHCNAFASPEAHGTETYYHPNSDNGRALARCIQAELVKNCRTADRGVKSNDEWTVLTDTYCPAVLVELAFLTNGKPYDWGTSYQAIPVDGSWRGTHTNMGIALEDGPRALSAALQCLDA